jgi:hypothetical protein
MAARGIRGLIAVTALLGLAACGSVSVGSAGHPASASAASAGASSASAASAGASSASASSAGASSAGASSASASAAAPGTLAAGSLCRARQSADRVVVSRIASPRQVTLTGAAQVQAMVAALCALPSLPAGQHCPAASAASVRLLFAAGAQSFPAVTVQESGCRSVTGLGATRWWSGSAPLSVLLDEAVGGLGRLAPGTHPSSVPTGP